MTRSIYTVKARWSWVSFLVECFFLHRKSASVISLLVRWQRGGILVITERSLARTIRSKCLLTWTHLLLQIKYVSFILDYIKNGKHIGIRTTYHFLSMPSQWVCQNACYFHVHYTGNLVECKPSLTLYTIKYFMDGLFPKNVSVSCYEIPPKSTKCILCEIAKAQSTHYNYPLEVYFLNSQLTLYLWLFLLQVE